MLQITRSLDGRPRQNSENDALAASINGNGLFISQVTTPRNKIRAVGGDSPANSHESKDIPLRGRTLLHITCWYDNTIC